MPAVKMQCNQLLGRSITPHYHRHRLPAALLEMLVMERPVGGARFGVLGGLGLCVRLGAALGAALRL